MMSFVISVVMMAPGLLGMATVEGSVMDTMGTPVAGARVFLEPGLAGALMETTATGDGRFIFSDVPAEGVGVFAIAPGMGFGGKHVNIAVAEEKVEANITLAPAVTLPGRIINHRGNAVEGARITRVGLLNDAKVGIPLGKLSAFGIELPVSDGKGEFSIPNLPQGVKVAIKINHPDYAQEAVENVMLDGKALKITLEPGVIVRGEVKSRESQRSIGGISVLVRNAQPPNDTSVVETDAQGLFFLRLKPGNYIYQAAGAGLRSPGWERLDVRGDQESLSVDLMVAATATVRGEIRDAVSGAPIPGVKILIETNGAKAAVVRTGVTGGFLTTVAEGDNLVRVENAPGYAPPAQSYTRIRVAAGEEKVLPGMWLTPLPVYRLHVLGEDGQQPVPGAIVTLLQPRQMGWHVTDPEGWAGLRVSQMPKDGRIIGLVEDPRHPLGALFVMGSESASGARVQLLKLAGVSGTTVNEKGKVVEGAVVGAEFASGLYEDDLVLWQCVSDRNGVFLWEAVVPGAPQRCIAKAGKDGLGVSMTFNPKPEAREPLGNVVVEKGMPAESLLGRAFPFKKYPCQQGDLPKEIGPAVIVFSSLDESAAVIESMQQAQKTLDAMPLNWIVVVDGPCRSRVPSMSILSGKAPGRATTCVLNKEGIVVLETLGLPPLYILQKVCQ
ncbi:MAG TPA: carboxypeptidase-like regulatory domain-containing protein [Candidatus Hydrogenedentes bacterium]|nr:carboxypeptidase-like regulatory domain-containing protein [Candidatus Hydrogenedentota bacterium]